MTLAGSSFQLSSSLNKNISLIQNGRRQATKREQGVQGQVTTQYGYILPKSASSWKLTLAYLFPYVLIHTYTPSSDLQFSIRNPEIKKVLNTEDLFVPYLATKPDHLNSFGGKTWPTTNCKLFIGFISFFFF